MTAISSATPTPGPPGPSRVFSEVCLMPGASDKTRRVAILNANWMPASDGGDGQFELMIVTDDEQHHTAVTSPAAMSAIVALTQADTVLAWDPANRTLIAANIIGTMPWTRTDNPPSPSQEPTVSDKPSILFVCVHNAGRSQMAAGWLRHLAGDRVEVRSAGAEPADQINPVAVQAMREVGIDIAAEEPKKLDYATAQDSDVIVTMGCGDTCPVFPGKRYEDWQLTDPAGQPIEVVRTVRDDIRARVEKLITELPQP
jgi:arsenate reductase (thioredoxin)